MGIQMKQAQEKNIDLYADFSKLEKTEIFSDEQRIKQVLLSIQAYALKNTMEGGEIKIKVRNYSDDMLEFLEFKVEETGLGIEY
jgi:signal transduction histidine kinase